LYKYSGVGLLVASVDLAIWWIMEKKLMWKLPLPQ
jgi:hypothetical protein